MDTSDNSPFSTHPTRAFKWGVIELIGGDHSIVDRHHVWFKTQREANAYGRRFLHAYLVGGATFPRITKSRRT